MTFKLHMTKAVLICAAVLTLAVTAAAAGAILGDADSDSDVTIIDATAIQRYLADLPLRGDFSEAAADVNASGEVDIMDATYIQRWLANIDTPYPIGDLLSEPTQPTEPTAQSSTDEDGWGHEVFRP